VDLTPHSAVADRASALPSPALTFATGLVLGILGVIGMGFLEQDRSARTAVGGPPAVRPVATSHQPYPDQPVPAPASNARPSETDGLPFVYYIVRSAEEAGSLLLAVGQSAGERMLPTSDGAAAQYRVLVVETPEQEGAALEAIARAGTSMVSVIDLRGAETQSPWDRAAR
jgi:hypothetical protein